MTIQNQGENRSIEVGLAKLFNKNVNRYRGELGNLVSHLEFEEVVYNGNGYIMQDDKWSYQNMKKISCEKFDEGDVVGCLMSRIEINKVWFLKIQFTKNGSKLNAITYQENGNSYTHSLQMIGRQYYKMK